MAFFRRVRPTAWIAHHAIRSANGSIAATSRPNGCLYLSASPNWKKADRYDWHNICRWGKGMTKATEALNYWRAAKSIRWLLRCSADLVDIEDHYTEIEVLVLHSDWPLLRDRASELLDDKFRIFGGLRSVAHD